MRTTQRPDTPGHHTRRLAYELSRIWQPAYTLASSYRRLATSFVYSILAVAAYAGAYLLRFDFSLPPEQRTLLASTLPLVVLLRLAASYVFGLSIGRWRYVGTNDVIRLVG